jgi:hypothetical protein
MWRIRFNSDSSAYSSDFGDHHAIDTESTAEPLDGFEHRIVTGVSAYSVVIFSRDKS